MLSDLMYAAHIRAKLLAPYDIGIFGLSDFDNNIDRIAGDFDQGVGRVEVTLQ